MTKCVNNSEQTEEQMEKEKEKERIDQNRTAGPCLLAFLFEAACIKMYLIACLSFAH